MNGYLFLLLNETFDQPVYFNDSLITAYAINKQEALNVMQNNFGDAVSGYNLLDRIIKINIVYNLPKIICEDDTLGDFEVLNTLRKDVSRSIQKVTDEGYLDDPE